MVDALELPGAGGAELDAVLGEGAQYLGVRVGVERAPAEGLLELGGEFGEQSRLGAGDGRAGAEELRQQPVVDVAAPGQPVVRHLGGHQRPGGLGGDQQPEPLPGGRVGDRGEPALLFGVDGDDGGQRVGAGRQLQPVGGEQGVLPVVGLGGAGLGQVVRDGQAAQPGPGGAERARRAERPSRVSSRASTRRRSWQRASRSGSRGSSGA